MFLTHHYARNCPLYHPLRADRDYSYFNKTDFFLSQVKFECDSAIMLYTISDTQDLKIMTVD